MRNLTFVLALILTSPVFAADTVQCSSCNSAQSAGIFGAATLYDHSSVSVGNYSFDIGWSPLNDKINVHNPVTGKTYLINLDAVPLTIYGVTISLPNVADPSVTLVNSISMDGQELFSGVIPNVVLKAVSEEQASNAAAGNQVGSSLGSGSGGGLGGSTSATSGMGFGGVSFGWSGGSGPSIITGVCNPDYCIMSN